MRNTKEERWERRQKEEWQEYDDGNRKMRNQQKKKTEDEQLYCFPIPFYREDLMPGRLTMSGNTIGGNDAN